MAKPKPYTKGGRTFYYAAVYVGRDEITGRSRYIKRRGFPTKADAKLWISRTELQAQGGALAQSRNPTYRDLYEQWAASYQNSVRLATFRCIKGIFVNHVLPALGDMRIQKITTPVLQKTVNAWSKQGLATFPEWYRRALMVLKYARQQRYITNDPAVGVIVPKVKKKAGDDNENFWDKAELAHFFSLLDPVKDARYYTMFRILAFTGLRRAECLALTWADIDLAKGDISVSKTLSADLDGHTIVQPPKTAAGQRVVSLDAETVAIIKRWRVIQIQTWLARGINANNPKQLVFPSEKNTPLSPSTVGNWLKYFQNKHHIKHQITPHGFRHSHASALLAAGVDIKVVQKRLGHESIKTTLAIYAHVTETQSDEAAQQVANYLNF